MLGFETDCSTRLPFQAAPTSAVLYRTLTPLLATVSLLGVPTLAAAAPVGPYRLAFITAEVYDATSTPIGTYNSDVTTSAAGNSALPATSWYAIASVSGESALDNITSCAGCDGSVPIYLVDGTLLANSVADLFTAGANGIATDQFGNASTQNYVWTGSSGDGSAIVGDELGSATPEYGFIGQSNPGDFVGTADGTNTDTFPLYAISGVIDAPEPASGSLLALSSLALLAVRRRRR